MAAEDGVGFEEGTLQLISIGGMPKSGTTLLLSLLDGLPELSALPVEAGVYLRSGPLGAQRLRRTMLGEGTSSLRSQFASASLELDSGQRDFLIRAQTMVEFLREHRQRVDSRSALLRDILLSWQASGFGAEGVSPFASSEAPKASTHVEKAPGNEAVWHLMMRSFDLQTVFVVRDPRVNYATYIRKYPDLSVAKFAHYWRQRLALAEACKATTIVKYEDLIVDPVGMVNNLLKNSGLARNTKVVFPTLGGHPWRGNSLWADEGSV